MNPAQKYTAILLGLSCIHLLRVTVSRVIVGFILVATLPACGKTESPPLATESKPAPKIKVNPSSSGDGLDKVLEEVNSDLSREDQALDQQADAIMDAHPNMTAQELLSVPEVKSKLADFLKALSKSPELQKRVNASIAFAATMKNLEGTKENWKFGMDFSSYDQPRTHRLITSILSERPERVVDFFEREVTQASAEFTLDPATPKSTNGITLEKKPDPEPPK